MTQRDYRTELFEKMKTEQERYRNRLLKQEPSEILSHSNEFTVREDIMMEMDVLNLSPKRAKALLKSPTPLADLYKEFDKRETDRMDVIRDCIESRADEVIRREHARESR